MQTSSNFTVNGAEVSARTTAKAENIEAFSVKGVRWFQKSYGNTYHVVYISALVAGQWVELGQSHMAYGHGDHFLVTAAEWLISNGYFECDSEYFLSNRFVRGDFRVESYVHDVARKCDL